MKDVIRYAYYVTSALNLYEINHSPNFALRFFVCLMSCSSFYLKKNISLAEINIFDNLKNSFKISKIENYDNRLNNFFQIFGH